jgi:uncharacterized protein YaaQ
MKVVFAITSSEGADDIADILKEKGFRVTLMSSMGGFLRRSSTTLMIGVRDEQVQEVLDIIRENAPPPPKAGWRLLSRQSEQPQSRVVAFVLNMPRFERYQP